MIGNQPVERAIHVGETTPSGVIQNLDGDDPCVRGDSRSRNHSARRENAADTRAMAIAILCGPGAVHRLGAVRTATVYGTGSSAAPTLLFNDIVEEIGMIGINSRIKNSHTHSEAGKSNGSRVICPHQGDAFGEGRPYLSINIDRGNPRLCGQSLESPCPSPA